jgi:hypothetical protein
VLFTDFTAPFRPVKKPDTTSALDEKKDEKKLSFLLDQYKAVVEEIRLRIEKEHHLYLLKFTYVGAVLASLFKLSAQSSGSQPARIKMVCLWATVAVAAIMDVRMTFNTVIISNLGGWGNNLEEALLGSTQALGWEHYFHAHSILFEKPLTMVQLIDRELLTWVLFVVALADSVLAIKPADADNRGLWMEIGRPASALCLFLSALTGLRSELWWVHLLWAGICVLLIWFWPWPSCVNFKPQVSSALQSGDAATTNGTECESPDKIAPKSSSGTNS